MRDLQQMVLEINQRAAVHRIGTVQTLRRSFANSRRQPEKRFLNEGDGSTYAFHTGGRHELQFNVGLDQHFFPSGVRYGVAFSFETSMSHRTIEDLLPKAALFNDFMRMNQEHYNDLGMWSKSRRNGFSAISRPHIIGSHLAKIGTFVFLGKTIAQSDLDLDDVLTTLDRLFQVWHFIETASRRSTSPMAPSDPWGVRPGWRSPVLQRLCTSRELSLDVTFRHFILQKKMYDILIQEFGYENVGQEHYAPGGGIIDLIALTPHGRMIFEIKTAHTARQCVREALGQIMDYGYWNGADGLHSLVIVGEPASDEEVDQYLVLLSSSLPAPVFYRSLPLDQSISEA